jgi:mRNA-degrading endonuclease RelE of RelBE toxin-antitoxin system
MSQIQVELSARFLKELERLSRKYPRVVEEIDKLTDRLSDGQKPGDKIPHIGFDVYKVRIKNPSAKRGKRGGFRVIYYVQVSTRIILLLIYSKTEMDNVSPEEIRQVIIDTNEAE